jgi:hypothetical protein
MIGRFSAVALAIAVAIVVGHAPAMAQDQPADPALVARQG